LTFFEPKQGENRKRTGERTVNKMTGKKGKPEAKKDVAKKAVKEVPEVKLPPVPKIKMSAKDKEELKQNLLSIRENLTGQMTALKDESLAREPADNTVEDGTDAFDRQVSLNLVSSEHDEVVAIDDALLRLDEGTYGVCEGCHNPIEKARIKALPFVRMCVKCQMENEKGKTKYRPLSSDTTM
jgi:DnaK suppressor protein